MKQILNIEETHNTREELIKVYYKDFNHYSDIDVKFEDVYEFIHHQLQKARQDWLQEEIVKLDGMKKMIDYTDTKVTALDRNKYYRLKGYEQGSNKALQTIIDRYHSELDQDNK